MNKSEKEELKKYIEERINWHRLFGLMATPLFEKIGCEVTVEFDLSLKNPQLDCHD